MNALRRTIVVATLTLTLTAPLATVNPELALAKPGDPPVDSDANSARGYVSPWDPDYFCSYQRVGSYKGMWCTHTPGKGNPDKLFVKKRPTAWWNPWTWF